MMEGVSMEWVLKPIMDCAKEVNVYYDHQNAEELWEVFGRIVLYVSIEHYNGYLEGRAELHKAIYLELEALERGCNTMHEDPNGLYRNVMSLNNVVLDQVIQLSKHLDMIGPIEGCINGHRLRVYGGPRRFAVNAIIEYEDISNTAYH